MADEIKFRHTAAAATLRAVAIKRTDGLIYDTVGAGYEAITDANWANYLITLTEKGTASQIYYGDAPAGLTTAIAHDVLIFAGTAITSLMVGQGVIVDYDGLTFESAVELLMSVLSGVAAVSGSNVSFKKRDGTTSKATIGYGSPDGTRTSSAVDS